MRHLVSAVSADNVFPGSLGMRHLVSAESAENVFPGTLGMRHLDSAVSAENVFRVFHVLPAVTWQSSASRSPECTYKSW